MAKLRTLIPSGLFPFLAGRLFRALVSLILFQIILFALIQAMPESNSAQSEGAAMSQALSQRDSESSQAAEQDTEEEPATQQEAVEQPIDAASVPPVIVRPPSSPSTEELGALRESGSPEMQMLLDEAAGEDKRVAQAEGTFIPTPAPTAAPTAAVENQAGQPEGEAATGEATEQEPERSREPATYEDGLEALRPREKTVVEQFLDWMAGFFTGDLGTSVVVGGDTVLEILADKLPETLLLFVPGTVGGLMLGFWLGKRVAWRQRGWLDFAATMGGTAFYTSFPPWLAFMMASIFAAYLHWVPPDGLRNPIKWYFFGDVNFNRMLVGILLTFTLAAVASLIIIRLTRRMRWYRTWTRIGAITAVVLLAAAPWLTSGLWPLGLDILHHLALPLAALILLSFGETMLIMRTTMAEAMQERFVTQVKAMGYSDARVRDRHVAPVAIVPVLARFVVHLPFVIIGSFFLEQRFFIDGMGKELVRAANEFDLPVLMGVLSLVGIGLLLAHVLFDVLTAWLDPRLRITSQAESG